MSELRLATRRSPLALVQATLVQRRLHDLGVESVLVPLETRGDRESDVSLDQLGAQGVFAVEVQRAVLNGDADVAVHSAKDLPSTTPDGLILACVPERLDAADVLIGRSLAGLGPGATVATGSAAPSRALARASTGPSRRRTSRQHGDALRRGEPQRCRRGRGRRGRGGSTGTERVDRRTTGHRVVRAPSRPGRARARGAR